MHDTTPSPLGEITRRWTQLTDGQRDRHVARLVPADCADGGPAHIDRPSLDGGRCYQQLVPAAVAGDPIALGWLATSHRPLLIARARPLFEHDPSEWGAVCLEVLHTTLVKADLSEPRWLRRRIANRLTAGLAKAVRRHLDRRRHERATVPARLCTAQPPVEPDPAWDPHLLDLSVDLDRALARFDEPTRDGLFALADHQPLTTIADRHGLTHDAVRQRVTRARKCLQPELAAYHRTAR